MDYIAASLSGVYNVNELASDIANLQVTKQDVLVSGTTIKTVNNNTLLGEGNVEVLESKLTEKLTTTISLGGITAGTVYPAGTTIEKILRDLFKANAGYKIFYGASENVPTTIESTLLPADIPEDFKEVGFTGYFTTIEVGEEDGKYCTFAYPTNFGNLAHIFCNDLISFDLIDNWNKIDVTVEGLSFYLYYQKVPTKDIDSKYQFLF